MTDVQWITIMSQCRPIFVMLYRLYSRCTWGYPSGYHKQVFVLAFCLKKKLNKFFFFIQHCSITLLLRTSLILLLLFIWRKHTIILCLRCVHLVESLVSRSGRLLLEMYSHRENDVLLDDMGNFFPIYSWNGLK